MYTISGVIVTGRGVCTFVMCVTQDWFTRAVSFVLPLTTMHMHYIFINVLSCDALFISLFSLYLILAHFHSHIDSHAYFLNRKTRRGVVYSHGDVSTYEHTDSNIT